MFEAEPEPPAPKPERRLAAAKTLRHASPHLDGARFGEDGRIPPGAGRNAVEVYYERFPITQNAARLDNLQEDDLIRACPDLERLRQVVTAYSRSSYRRGNLQLILDWYADPARYQPPTRAAPQAAQPRSKVQASLDAVDYVFDRLKQEQQEQSPHG